MSVEGYEALIEEAKKEIECCKQMISIINSVNGNLSNCVNALYNSIGSLDAGLIVNGKVESAPINDNLCNSIGLIKVRIAELDENIVVWEKAKKSLLAYLASLKEKIFGKKEQM